VKSGCKVKCKVLIKDRFSIEIKEQQITSPAKEKEK